MSFWCLQCPPKNKQNKPLRNEINSFVRFLEETLSRKIISILSDLYKFRFLTHDQNHGKFMERQKKMYILRIIDLYFHHFYIVVGRWNVFLHIQRKKPNSTAECHQQFKTCFCFVYFFFLHQSLGQTRSNPQDLPDFRYNLKQAHKKLQNRNYTIIQPIAFLSFAELNFL